MAITADTTLEELAAIVSQALEAAGIRATLSGGAAVSIYTENEYQSLDLDFVTSARRTQLIDALAPLGFLPDRNRRYFTHAQTDYFLEFPPGPVEFGNRLVRDNQLAAIETTWGSLRIVTATQCVMDRLSAFWHWNDRQSWDQAVMVARHQHVDFDELTAFANGEGADPNDIVKLREQALR